MKTVAIVGIAVIMSACAGMGRPGIVGNPASVTISNVWNQSAAQSHADKHCAQFGKVARYNTGTPDTYHFSFDCVAP
ncbi:hypothetical protein [Sphingomonas turrisvirgatae]|uniref:Lipoprotein n=1 Tax=Sphingomonas turrisvirgatae TaxID=1888892 RepID=A0A1E3LZN2_9SPHN|nr:hypothetical protein [Sphingomonas turrisvirgatae]ODP39252.1 hypothetical protein BFL28_10590 [Sphingomonas turrisvirgatae]